MYNIIFSPQAKKDARKVSSSGLKLKVQKLIVLIEKDPLQHPPDFEYLKGNMINKISRRINKQHRLVYEIFENEKLVKIYRMWTHYE